MVISTNLFIYLFTSFSGHRPAQRDVHERDSGPRRGVIPTQSHNPQRLVGHTTGVYDPYSFRIVGWVLLRPARTNQ